MKANSKPMTVYALKLVAALIIGGIAGAAINELIWGTPVRESLFSFSALFSSAIVFIVLFLFYRRDYKKKMQQTQQA